MLFCFVSPLYGQRVNFGGSIGYGTTTPNSTFVWSSWVGMDIFRKSKISPYLGIQVFKFTQGSIFDESFTPQLQVGVYTTDMTLYYGFYNDQLNKQINSIGLGFNLSYQQYRVEYIIETKTILFGAGYRIK